MNASEEDEEAPALSVPIEKPEAIQALDEFDETCAPSRLLPIPSSDYPTPAQRPLNSRLNNDRLEQVFGLRLQDWRAALALCMEG